MAVNPKAIKVLNKVLDAGFTDEKAIAAMTIDDILNMQGVTVADIGMPIIWSVSKPRSMKWTARGKWQGSVLLKANGNCPLRISGTALPCGFPILSVTLTDTKKTCSMK